ncbi:hypothetical protein CVT26_013010 [Gymnopilus dilepis]|uniref:Uncharacterized protein n=1 Tax=Gymnopilus dilepis TaxID=231916 RepID=A0A409WVF7_9AGAR|nr:hypothetical protein CVT26_013010 [Gymnopilus dilepis]
MDQGSIIPTNWIIRRVPPDIWRYILCLVQHDSYRPSLQMVCLSHVCRAWRAIAIAFPELWAQIDLETSAKQGSAPKVELLALVLERSGALPLTMTLRVEDDFSVASIEAFKLFCQATDRAKNLTLYLFSFGFLNSYEVEKEIGAGHILEALTLYMPRDPWKEIQTISTLWAPAPLLRSLSLFGAHITLQLVDSFTASAFPFRQLSVLNVEPSIEMEALLHIMSMAPSLEAVTIDVVEGDFDDTDDEFVRDVELPALQSLVLKGRGCFQWSSPPLTQLLKFITSPLLTTLSLRYDRDWSPESFEIFLIQSSPRIEHLHLDIVNSSEQDKIQCIRLLPFLKTLDFSIDNPEERETFIGEEFCAAMKEWNPSARGFAICPNLEKFTIDYPAIYDPSSTIFADMVNERLKHSPKGKNFEVVITDAYELGQEQKMLSEMIRLLVLEKAGLKLTIEPLNWLVELFKR